MRILKGQEILPDDTTLVQHNITDGNTVSVLIEPDHNIEVEVQCGPMVYKHNVSHCMIVKQLKALLIDSNEVAFFHKHVNFVTNKDKEQYMELEDESLPLHYLTSDTHLKLKVLPPSVFIKSINPFGGTAYHKVTNKTTVSELKNILMKFRQGVTDISMFVTCGNDRYKRLDEAQSTPAYKQLPHDKTVYFIEDRISFSHCWPVSYQYKEVGKVYGNKSGSTCETVLGIKLRIQEEMGVPTNGIIVYKRNADSTRKLEMRDTEQMHISDNDRVVWYGIVIEIKQK